MGFLSSLSLPAVLAIAALMPIPAVNAHMSMFHPSMYGADKSDPETVYPLANKGFGQWWFHGNLDNPSQVSMPINPGQPLTVEIACSKSLTTLGGNPGNTDSCPNDQGSYHAGGQGWGGWGSNQASQLMGCALAIAYKSDANAVRPEDFIVMSVQENCVRQRNTQFDIPSNLPACPEGGCTCAWFWQGQASAEEMYMTGFKCNVNGGAVGANIPTPGRPKLSGNSDGPTQPFYWANDMKNVDFNIGWDTRPKYNGKMGWSNGAQNKAFSGAGGSPGSPATPTKSQGQGQGAQPTQSQGQGGQGQGQGGQWQGQGGQGQGQGGQGQGQGGQANPDFPNYAAGPQTGAGSGNSNGNGTGAPHKPCKTVRRRRRSRVRRAAH